MGFQNWRLINQVQAKEFFNPGGPPVFELLFWGGQWRLINRAGLINPDLPLETFMCRGVSIARSDYGMLSLAVHVDSSSRWWFPPPDKIFVKIGRVIAHMEVS